MELGKRSVQLSNGDSAVFDPPSIDFTQQLSPGVAVASIDSDGFVGGVQAGYNKQWRGWLGGLEIDLSGSGVDGATSNSTKVNIPTGSPDTNFVGATTASVKDKIDLLGSTRARLGFLVTPDLLVYGTGGLGWTRFVQELALTRTGTFPGFAATLPTNQLVTSDPSWRFGWVGGGGGEARLFDSNWLARVEYLHYNFGDSGASHTTVSVSPGAFLADTNDLRSGDLTVDVVRGGLSYQFGP